MSAWELREWLTMRVITITGMWRLHFWHGRWSTLAVGAALMTIGFALAVLAVAGLASLLALREWWRWRRNPQRDDQPHSALLH